MTEFEARRDELAAHRLELERTREQALLAREAARRAEQKLATFERSAGRRDQAEADPAGGGAARRAGPRRKARPATRQPARPGDGAGRCLRRLHRSAPLDGPVVRPVSRSLLFPLRLETRFKQGPAGQPQLWVRVYPDTCLIDTFEASLTEQEVADAQVFWANIWRAAGDEAEERAAWRELVGAHGSGRAGWIVRQYLPLNPADKPIRNDPAAVFLIIIAPGPLPAAAGVYWGAVWMADGDPVAAAAAYQALESAVGSAQARGSRTARGR